MKHTFELFSFLFFCYVVVVIIEGRLLERRNFKRETRKAKKIPWWESKEYREMAKKKQEEWERVEEGRRQSQASRMQSDVQLSETCKNEEIENLPFCRKFFKEGIESLEEKGNITWFGACCWAIFSDVCMHSIAIEECQEPLKDYLSLSMIRKTICNYDIEAQCSEQLAAAKMQEEIWKRKIRFGIQDVKPDIG